MNTLFSALPFFCLHCFPVTSIILYFPNVNIFNENKFYTIYGCFITIIKLPMCITKKALICVIDVFPYSLVFDIYKGISRPQVCDWCGYWRITTKAIHTTSGLRLWSNKSSFISNWLQYKTAFLSKALHGKKFQ